MTSTHYNYVGHRKPWLQSHKGLYGCSEPLVSEHHDSNKVHAVGEILGLGVTPRVELTEGVWENTHHLAAGLAGEVLVDNQNTIFVSLPNQIVLYKEHEKDFSGHKLERLYEGELLKPWNTKDQRATVIYSGGAYMVSGTVSLASGVAKCLQFLQPLHTLPTLSTMYTICMNSPY